MADVRFYPAWSGAIAGTHFAGVNFASLDYGRGPCAGSDPTQFTPRVEQIYAGKLSGRSLAVVQLRCDFPIGFNDDVLIYGVSSGKAALLARAGSFAYPANDDPYVDGGWLRVRFAGDALYLDEWQFFKQCVKNGDWIAATFAMRSQKLVKIHSEVHHRASVALACDPSYAPTPMP